MLELKCKQKSSKIEIIVEEDEEEVWKLMLHIMPFIPPVH